MDKSIDLLKKQNILFFTRGMGLGGTEKVIIQLCNIFRAYVNSIIVCGKYGENVSELKKIGVKFVEIPDIENKSIFTIMKVSKILKDIIENEKITIIHTHHRMAAFYVSFLKLYKKCKFINTSHNAFYDRKILTQIALKHANLVACGNLVKKNLADEFKIYNVTAICNSVQSFNYSLEKDPFIDEIHSAGYFVVGNIGRLSKQKGMEYFIKAIPEVIKKYSKTKFLIIGSGEDENKLKKLVDELGINNVVRFVGYRKDIQNLMSQLDLIVLSSLWEGFPLTIIESFSVGKTIVATAVDGSVEIVKDRENGLLVEPKSSEQISEKIIWMIEHPIERKLMEENAKKSYENDLSMKKFESEYIDFYLNVI